MHFIRSTVVCLFGLVGLASSARATNKIKVDWQPISREDLALKDNSASHGDDAMILYREVVIDDWNLSMTEYVRIKIFTEEGRKWAEVQVPFVPGFWEIKELRARTIHPDGTITDFKGQTFDALVVKARGVKVRLRRFSLPDVQPGCIIEYIYEHHGPPAFLPDDWTIQSDLYTRSSVFTYRPFSGPIKSTLRWRGHRLPPGFTAPQKQNDGSYRLEVRDLPGIKREDFMPPEKVVLARVGFFYYFAVKNNETAAEYWKALGKAWSKDFEDFLNKKHFLEEVAAQTALPDDPPEAKLRKFYARAQQIRNLDYASAKAGSKPEVFKDNVTIEDVIKHGYGTSRQIDAVLIGLARAAGFEAWQVHFTSRDDDFFAADLFDPEQLNGDLVYIRSGLQDLYLDPGDPYFPYGLLPWYASEAGGFRLSPDGGVLISTSAPLSFEARLVRQADLHVDTDGAVSGKVQIDFTGQRACIRREEDREMDELGKEKDLESEIKSWLPPDAEFATTSMTGWNSNSVPLHVEGKLHIPTYATIAARRMLVPVTVFSTPRRFESATRVNSIYFEYPYQEEDELTFQWPAGYSVEALPPGEKTPKSLVEFNLAAKQDGDFIRVHRFLSVDGYSFPVEAYPSLRTFFHTAASADKQQIIFRAVQ